MKQTIFKYKSNPMDFSEENTRKNSYCNPIIAESNAIQERINYINLFFKYLIPITFLTFFLSSCEDPIPSDYIPATFVEAVLIVDKPIEKIIVMRTQPLNKPFDYNASLIDDAEVTIRTEGKEYNLVFRNDDNPGYYFPDTSEKVKPETTYTLEIKLKDGSIITGKTTTPKQTNWIYTPGDTVYYPKDTLKLAPVDSLRIEYAPVPNNMFYLLSVVCNDTLDYGKYLNPPTEEKNRRIIRPWNEDNDHYFYNLTNWTFLPTTKTPIVWTVFKWFGKHTVNIYVPDANYLNWFLQYIIKGSYDPQLSSVNGAIGVFGSVSEISHNFFLIKNQK